LIGLSFLCFGLGLGDRCLVLLLLEFESELFGFEVLLVDDFVFGWCLFSGCWLCLRKVVLGGSDVDSSLLGWGGCFVRVCGC